MTRKGIITNTSHGLFANFVTLCTCFSITHASVDSILDYASSELGPFLGAHAGFLLYVFYTFSSLIIAKPIVSIFGQKVGIMFGLLCLLFYVICFYISILLREYSVPVFLFGASVCGVGAGVAWTAQSSYYSKNADLYAASGGFSQSDTNSNFAAVFAFIYLGFEAFTKGLSTLIFLFWRNGRGWKIATFGVYTATCFLSFLASFFISDFNDRCHSNARLAPVFSESTSALKFIFKSWKLALLLPYYVSFGLHSGFIGFYVNRMIVANQVGAGYIGIFSALATSTAAILAFPYSKVSKKLSKYYVLIFGSLTFAFCGASLLFFTDSQIGRWPNLFIYYIIHGASRGAWENTGKAVIADYFIAGGDRELAYACIYFSSGLAGAIGYALFPLLHRDVLAWINTAIPLMSLVCTHLCFVWYPPLKAALLPISEGEVLVPDDGCPVPAEDTGSAVRSYDPLPSSEAGQVELGSKSDMSFVTFDKEDRDESQELDHVELLR